MTRVLIVDNDPWFRRVAQRALTSWGHDVVGEAGTAAEALRLAAELGPDSVLADIGLPDGDGMSLASELRSLPSPPRVILTSADDDPALSRVAVRAGASGFVPKHEVAGARLRSLIA